MLMIYDLDTQKLIKKYMKENWTKAIKKLAYPMYLDKNYLHGWTWAWMGWNIQICWKFYKSDDNNDSDIGYFVDTKSIYSE